jgi:hypothetical protein
MKRHLFFLKNACPSITGIVLSEDIKHHILKNRIYHQPNPIALQVPTTINNIQIFVNNIPIQKKIDVFTKFNNVKLLNYEDKVSDIFEDDASSMVYDENYKKSYNDLIFEMRSDAILQVIDKTCQVSFPDFHDFSIFYDSNLDYVHIMESGEWSSSVQCMGIKHMMEIIQTAFLNVYEKYLVRHYELVSCHRLKQKCEELLSEYYTFLSVFDLQPCIKDLTNDDILENGSESISCSTAFHEMFIKIKKQLKSSVKQSWYRDVLKIISKHTKATVSKLNTDIINTMNDDVSFQNSFVPPPHDGGSFAGFRPRMTAGASKMRLTESLGSD